MVRRWKIIIPAILLLSSPVGAQEIITGTFSNRILNDPSLHYRLKSTKGSDTLLLPFIDDFSSGMSLPDESLWEDKFVFINNTYPINQLTQGVATFDAINEYGALYSNASYSVFAADTLTSKPIDLTYNAADSVYLSFLYEPGGIADMPEENDSLTLEFYAPAEKKWQSVWRTNGGGDVTFIRVMFRITTAKYLKKGFRFRFTNYASLASVTTEPSKAGNADQWNLDCIFLNSGRTVNDTVMHDVSFTSPTRSLLTNIEAMPWNQFKKAYLIAMSPTATLFYRNNDTIIRNITRNITITDQYKKQVVKNIAAGATNVDPLTDIYFNPALLYTYNSTTPDSALFLVKSTLITDDFDPKENDTISFLQFFGDYFAYDDGTAEAGYGINGEGSDNAMVALRYRSYMADSVAGISICFNDAFNNANQRYFTIEVWSDNDGKPGNIIASKADVLAKPATDNNGFVTYRLDKPVYVDGFFWVGWKQASETFLNVGLDLNTPHQDRQYYWLNGNWYTSSVTGTVLMRAVMSGDGTGTSSDDHTPSPTTLFRLYPNPASESITVICPDNNDQAYKLAIYSLNGSLVMMSETTSNVSISHLSQGNYIVVVKSSGNKSVAFLKLIKSN